MNFVKDLFPHSCVVSDGVDVQCVEREVSNPLPFVVTSHTVLIEERTVDCRVSAFRFCR